MTRTILLRDIAATAHLSGLDFGATIRPERVALRGRREVDSLPSGLRLHTLDAAAETDFETRIQRAPSVVLHVVLEGAAEASIGAHPLRLARLGDAPVRMAFYALRDPAPFVRRAKAGAHMRKVTIDIDWDWLAARGIGRDLVLGGADFRHEDWPASTAETAMATELLALDRRAAQGETRGEASTVLTREALVFGLVSGLIARLAAGAHPLRPAEMERLQRLEDRALRPGPVPDLAQIASEAGLSLSSLQRLFHRAYGTSAKDRIRSQRMARAEAALRAGASVAEAAHVAGFVSVESFSTAFKRHSGLSPSALLGRE